ncbi:MAG: AAA family ATPase, partial [Cyanobacteria bacterium P01_F01_bin.143]
SQGETGMILVAGYSGIGKSALVNEIHKPITAQRGKFIRGKFDQLQRDIPYSAIAQAFQDLIRQLLSEPEETLQTWKEKILEVLDNNGQIIIDVIPELEKIIGKQPVVEQLDTTENQNRFNAVFQKFLLVFCQQEHPLVIFIDDLQWADLASLNLIETLISDPDINYLLLIGAYRDNEVNSTHPLIHTLEKIDQAKISINKIILAPLKTKDINQLIADTLKCFPEVSQSLAELVTKKTGGNPFFLTQLLYSLYQENLLVFNANQSFNSKDNQGDYWQWDIEEIKTVSITDNVLDLMSSKIEKLEQKTQQIIKLAACIGNQFDLETLSIINNKSQADTAKELQPTLEEGLIIPLDNNYKVPILENLAETSDEFSNISISYKFLHDRVQQAAYSLIPETDKQPIHLQIGYLLLDSIKGNISESRIFDIVNHFNKGSSLITEQAEKDKLAQLNLQAGINAQSSIAHELAAQYFNAGLQLLATDAWENQYQLTLELYLKILEDHLLNNNFEGVEEISLIIIEQAKDVFDLLKIYQSQSKSFYYYVIINPQKAIDTSLKVLPKLGIDISLEAEEIEARTKEKKEYIESILKDRTIGSLAELPEMVDKVKLASIPILMKFLDSLYTVSLPLYIEVQITLISLCLEYGNPPQASRIYNVYGFFLCNVIEKIEEGYQFGQLALRLLEKNNNSELNLDNVVVLSIFYGCIWCWKNKFNSKKAYEQLLDVLQQAIDSESNDYACFTSVFYCLSKLLGGCDLEEVIKDCEKYIILATEINRYPFVRFLELYKNLARNLKDISYFQDCLLIDNAKKNQNFECQFIEENISNNQEWLLYLFYSGKAFNFYFSKSYAQSLDSSKYAEKYVPIVGSPVDYSAQNNFYFSLSALALYNHSKPEQRDYALPITMEKIAMTVL